MCVCVCVCVCVCIYIYIYIYIYIHTQLNYRPGQKLTKNLNMLIERHFYMVQLSAFITQLSGMPDSDWSVVTF